MWQRSGNGVWVQRERERERERDVGAFPCFKYA